MVIKSKKYCEHCKTNVQNLDTHMKTKAHLQASGILDTFSNVIDRFKGKRLDGFNNESTKTINKYADSVIKSLVIARKPIEKVLDTVINLLTLNTWSSLKKKYGFDDLFHLCLIVELGNGTKIYCEKIDAVTISLKDKISGSKTEYLNVSVPNNLTFKSLIEGARKYAGSDKKFFDYDAFSNNCQVFVGDYLLKSIGKYGEKERIFIYQDLEKLSKEMPSYSKTIMKGVTDLGQVSNRIMGKGKKKVQFKKGGALIDDSNIVYGKDTDTKKLKNSADFEKQYQDYLASVDMELPVLRGQTKKDRDRYRDEMAIYNKKVKSKEKEFNQQYKDEINGNLDRQFAEAGYTKDKNGIWRKPASLDDIGIVGDAFKAIGLEKWGNDMISTGENLYNKPNLANAVKAVSALKDAPNVGKKLVEDNLKKVEKVKNVVNTVRSVTGKGSVRITRDKSLLLVLI